jgi:hypothetical protein
MRKARFAFALSAVGAVMVVAAAAASAETIRKKKVVETTVTMAHQPGTTGQEYTGATFSGDVGSPKAKCVRNRNLTVKLVNGPNVGQTKSNATGNWTLLAGSTAVKPGEQYAVQVAKEKLLKEKTKANGDRVKKKVVCQPASETITIP